MTMKPTKFISSLGINYPSLRDGPLKSALKWLEGKRLDDGAEGLWRIHDNLYDLTEFIHKHPGGEEWIKLTKGTDITEAFETHHLTSVPDKILKNYFCRKATTCRNSPFTFNDDGFYKVLKRNIIETLKHIPKNQAERSKILTDFLAVGYLGLVVLSVIFRSFGLGILAGICLSLVAIAAHNFFHQKDNFRMYYFNFTFLDYQDWRISHALSHHLYTNTINDLEISMLEPFIQYLPTPEKKFSRFIQLIISPGVYIFTFFGSLIKSIIQVTVGEKPYRHSLLLPFVILAFMVLISGDLLFSVFLFLFIQLIGSLHFAAIGLNAAHHHPEIFHDGDTPRPKEELDWGIYQLDAVMDRKDITGSHFLVLTNFGDHALHHLFPTIDHGLLEFLYPTFLKTCASFGIEWRLTSQRDLVKGQIQQVLKISPKEEPPRPLQPVKFL